MFNLGPNIRLIVLNNKKSEIHGHRGCRGYFPENSIEGFIHALRFDIEAIELDVVVSKDHQVLVSHEPYMHHKKCLWPNLQPITKKEEAVLLIYQMSYKEISAFDCGLLAHPDYPQLKTVKAYKPLLSEVIQTIELACYESKRKPIVYNIEIKSDALLIGKVQPDYEVYARLVLNVIASFPIESRVIIQSFDKQLLNTIFKMNNLIPLSLLIEDAQDPFIHIEELGFKPSILASHYIYLNAEQIAQLKAEKVKVFAFTVNEIKDIKKMLAWGVDAIITDYPDVAISCL